MDDVEKNESAKKVSAARRISFQIQKQLSTIFRYSVDDQSDVIDLNNSSQGAPLFSTSGNEYTASVSLHQLAREGKHELMKRILERYPKPLKRKKVNSLDEEELTPLHYAARYHYYWTIKLLISHDGNVQALGEDNMTPLHLLARYPSKFKPLSSKDLPIEEKMSCLFLLLNAGASLTSQDDLGLTALHHACIRGNISFLTELLEFGGVNLEVTDNQGMTPLHHACLYGHFEIVQKLVQNGCKLNCKDKDSTTPLHLICVEGSADIAKCLLDEAEKFLNTSKVTTVVSTISGPSNSKKRSLSLAAELIKEKDNDQNLPIHLAIENGHVEIVEYLLEAAKRYDIKDITNQRRIGDYSCLHLAVEANSLALVKMLVEEDAEVNCRTSQQITPIYIAAQHDFLEIVNFLIEKNANIELKNSDMMTPLMIASRNGHINIVSTLLNNHADFGETDQEDKSSLMLAAEENNSEVIMLLLEKSDRKLLEGRDRNSNTGLHLASMKGNEDCVKLLLELKAPTEAKNASDRTALHVAAINGHSTFISNLVSSDRSILNCADDEGNTALHLAAIEGNSKCVFELLNNGANLELRNSRNWTALDCAAANGWEKVSLKLLKAGAKMQSSGKIRVCALHLACKRGHANIVQLLLDWKADITFKSLDGKNALDFALDFAHKECVLPLLKHHTWKQSLRNACKDRITGLVDTPMRKLIRKMPEMAEIVLDKCIVYNGKLPFEDGFTANLLYEFLDDTYACTSWVTESESSILSKSCNYNQANNKELSEDINETYDENDDLTTAATSYDAKPKVLKGNHPLNIMVSSKCSQLLVHPLVTSLLTYKWTRFSRYVYYSNLLLFTMYLLLLNTYMMLIPRFYMVDWTKTNMERSKNFSNSHLTSTHQENCLYLRSDLPNFLKHSGCFEISEIARHLRLVILSLSILALMLEVFFISMNTGILKLQQVISSLLYLLCILLTSDFYAYDITQNLSASSNYTTFTNLGGIQHDTGIRQKWQEKIGAYAVFCSWMTLLLMLQNVPLIPNLGIFIVMFTDTLKTFVQFLVILVFFIIGFALSFSILIGNQVLFQRWQESIVTVFVMMIGEIDYGGRFYRSENQYSNMIYTRDASFLMFIIFVIVMTIIIMNLLVGLAVGDIMQVRQDATLQRLGLQINSALEIEFFLPSLLSKKFSRRRQIFKQKGKTFFDFYSSSSILALLRDFKTSQTVIDEDCEEVENFSEIDRVLSVVLSLRTKFEHMIDEQGESKYKIQNLTKNLSDFKTQCEVDLDVLKSDLAEKTDNLRNQISTTYNHLLITNDEVVETQGQLNITQQVLEDLKKEFRRQEEHISSVSNNLHNKIESVDEDVFKRTEKLVNLEDNLQQGMVRSKSEVITNMNTWQRIEDRLSSEILQVKKDLDGKSEKISEIHNKLQGTTELLVSAKDEINRNIQEIKTAFAHKFTASDV